MPVRDLARDDVVDASPETAVSELARTMRDESVGSIVITDDDDVPVGIVTDRDLTTRVLAAGESPDDQTAEDVMSTDLCAVGEDAGFYDAAQAMSENGVRRLPVCAENDEIAGIITADDLTELLADENQQLAEVIRAQRPPY
ncbi:CBS domain-containing protein [Natronomonas sp. LN261]|jgi:signal-transduction protein with cAMP-binding, CBS, and nucleotidyltransferase domain|uniref:CBS domain-containing protein n=1 Tax=Natronomonas sp. LN261 TaxID=2750669 RepID=UPI0015EF196E|nr:CBS domain-containing protein [Natronomonas sp. LN261]